MKYINLSSIFAGVLALAHTHASPTCDETIEADVAIIGGGSAGIHAAINLKDAGAKVVVIEKKSQIGGHAETYINPVTKIPVNVGVVVFENTDLVKDYFKRLGVATAEVSATNLSSASKSYDFSDGIFIPAQNASASAAATQAIVAAIETYSQKILSKYSWVDKGFYVPEPVPEELTIPFSELAQKYNFSALLPIVAQFNWYFGNITTVPALYGVKAFGPGLLSTFVNKFIIAASGDTRSLYDAAAKELGDSVLLDASILSVSRLKEKTVSVVVEQPNKTRKLIRARKLLVAIPPVLKNVGSFDLDKSEHELFSKFSARGYVAGVANISGLDIGLQNVGARTPVNTPIIPGTNGFYSTGSPNQFSFGVGFDSYEVTSKDGEKVIHKELTTLATAGAVSDDAVKKIAFPFISNHSPYALRVSAKEIADGFYHKLIALEGSHNTYWAGATFSGQNSALVWAWNNGTVLPAIKKGLGL